MHQNDLEIIYWKTSQVTAWKQKNLNIKGKSEAFVTNWQGSIPILTGLTPDTMPMYPAKFVDLNTVLLFLWKSKSTTKGFSSRVNVQELFLTSHLQETVQHLKLPSVVFKASLHSMHSSFVWCLFSDLTHIRQDHCSVVTWAAPARNN